MAGEGNWGRQMHSLPHPDQVRADFDEIARLDSPGGSGDDYYDDFILSLVPSHAHTVLDAGCGTGRLTIALATPGRCVIGLDLSPEMIRRGEAAAPDGHNISFIRGDLVEHDFGAERFDCIVSAAMLHHLPAEHAIRRMTELLLPGGRLIIHDLRSDDGVVDRLRSAAALAGVSLLRFVRTGRFRSPRRVRQAWARHGARESYPTFNHARNTARLLLPGASIFYHWLWRYTIVWDRPAS